MTTAYDKYRAKMSVEEEDRLVEEACKKVQLTTKSAALLPCQTDPLFRSNPPAGDPGPWKGNTAFNYRCWQTLPTLQYGKIPSNFLGDQAAVDLIKDPLHQCREQARARIQIERAIAPDTRFWVGLGAAGVGVLVAFTAKMIRRR